MNNKKNNNPPTCPLMNEQSTDIGDQFMRIIYIIHNNFHRQVDIPLPASHMFILVFLSSDGPTTITQIANSIKMSKQQIGPIVDKLYRSGLINKDTLPDDRRRQLITISEKGTEMLKIYSDGVRQLFLQKIKNYDTKEKNELSAALQTIYHHLSSNTSKE